MWRFLVAWWFYFALCLNPWLLDYNTTIFNHLTLLLHCYIVNCSRYYDLKLDFKKITMYWPWLKYRKNWIIMVRITLTESCQWRQNLLNNWLRQHWWEVLNVLRNKSFFFLFFVSTFLIPWQLKKLQTSDECDIEIFKIWYGYGSCGWIIFSQD